MNKPMEKDTQTQTPQKVVMEYLDALLSEVEVIDEPTVQVKQAEIAVDVPETVVETEVSVPQTDNLTDDTLQTETSLEKAVNEAFPALTEDEFQALLFDVAGVKFAVSLDKLNGILEWSDQVTQMPNSSEWFIGVLDERDRRIKVIDIATLVVPSKFRANRSHDALKKIILIGDSYWGLACDAVSEVITLQQDDVKWRSVSSKRPWLAGTVKEHMCALIDVDEFAELLSSDKLEPAE